MDDISRSISQYVKSGKYYEDARTWYVNKFITPISEKAYLMILLVFYIFVLLIGVYYYNNTNPADPEVSYLVFRDDITKTYALIHPVDEKGETPDIRVTKYLLKRYVEARESYDIKNLKNQLDYIKNTTVHLDYLRYQEMMSINNPSSPMMIYQDLYVKKIKVHKINLLKSKNYDGTKAVVYFQSILKNTTTNNDTIEEYAVTIGYKVGNIKELIKTKSNKFEFLVSSYDLHKINGSNNVVNKK